VAISFVVATLASYTALDLTGRISLLASARLRHAWRLGGALALGVGIWSMHFIAMLAFSLPIPLGYDLATTACSLGLAIGVSYLALFVTTQARLTPGRLLAGGVLMGFGIAGMHYTGMAALQMTPAIHYQPAWLAGSLAIAIGASSAALWMAHALSNDDERHVVHKRFAAALVMGVAICGMHYAGMAAAGFAPGAVCGAAKGVNAAWLATSVILLTFAILILTLMLSRFDAHTSLLTGAVSRLNGEILRLATLDTLTGLPNRSTLTERIERAINGSRRQHAPFAILFMDLDGFKTINDSLGHSAGDAVLSAFAQRLQQCVRAADTVARLGGDEFVVLAENLGSREAAAALAEAVLERMRRGMWADSQPLQVMPSIGIALYPHDGDTVETLLKHADAAMYEAKRAGRSTYRFFERSMNEAATRTLEIQSALHAGLAADLFSLEFQPKFHGGNDSLAGAEALIRLRHPRLGTLTPAEFIPIAELRPDRTDWLLGRARNLPADSRLDRTGPAGNEGGDQPVAASTSAARPRREHAGDRQGRRCRVRTDHVRDHRNRRDAGRAENRRDDPRVSGERLRDRNRRFRHRLFEPRLSATLSREAIEDRPLLHQRTRRARRGRQRDRVGDHRARALAGNGRGGRGRRNRIATRPAALDELRRDARLPARQARQRRRLRRAAEGTHDGRVSTPAFLQHCCGTQGCAAVSRAITG
jgi:diguanylate cyclase (GGDEF)-like protein